MKKPRPQTTSQYPDEIPAAGTKLVLYVCEGVWAESPAELVREVDWTVPKVWNAAAIRDLIETVRRATDDQSGAHQAVAPQTYCRLRYVKSNQWRPRPELYFPTQRSHYEVQLPLMPAAAVTEFLCNPDLLTSADFHLASTERRHESTIRPRVRVKATGGAR